jgi:crotonobetainyl-CoA:carnitine CoA-transferase CaiB-like acyl-CoA transferase
MTPPLEGVVVADFSELLPGPFLTQSLAELGAHVIKVERPPHGDPTRRLAPGVFRAVNRGKASILSDLKDPVQVEKARATISRADIVVEGFRPGVMKRLGLDYAALAGAMPRLIYVSLTGYGQTGPMAPLPGHDVNYLATGGAIALSGQAAGPPAHAFGLPAADLCAATYALAAVLAALVQRGRTGAGQHIDVAMADCVAHWMNPRLAQFDDAGLSTLSAQRDDALVKPAYGAFSCADGAIVTIGALEDHFWRRLNGVLDLTPFNGPTFATFAARIASAAAINARLAEETRRLSAPELVDRLRAADVPVAEVVPPAGICAHPQFAARGLYHEGLARFPVRLAGMADALSSTAPLDSLG